MDRNEAFAEMLGLILEFEGRPGSYQDEEWRHFDDFITKLAESGWTRKEIYHLAIDVDKAHSSSMPEECSDALSNFISGLVGQVAVGYEVRLPGEPTDLDEHALYVREMKWLE